MYKGEEATLVVKLSTRIKIKEIIDTSQTRTENCRDPGKAQHPTRQTRLNTGGMAPRPLRSAVLTITLSCLEVE
jgi:hypothetical protein